MKQLQPPRIQKARAEAVKTLLAAVRHNRPSETYLLEYLENYCRVAWQLGYAAGKRRAKKEVAVIGRVRG